MRTLITTLLLAAAATAAQADTTVGMHLGSWHSRPGFNNTNPGLYLHTGEGLTLGSYRNSYLRTTTYAGKTWETGGEGLRLAVTAGLCTGYDKPVLVVPSVTVPVSGARLRIAALPPADKHGAAVVHLAVEFKL